MSKTYGVSMWKSIRSGWLDFSKKFQYDVGDGTIVKVWEDVWCSRVGIVLLKNCFQHRIVLGG